ncbi:MAG TPA: 3-hydroxyacyl-CoA dehydrogenase NAD-binding domain-containing protein, partial [Terracidiphilus sp.]|nr:3-hydroxyacyl-CoA dehydrogenase NAD-binding domain-containing protein [Terracidiphilus sp.]
MSAEEIASRAGTAAASNALLVRRAAVLGAGTMGSRIAAHLANAGIPVLLLDLPAKDEAGIPPAKLALAALAKSKPAALFDSSLARLITPGTFDDDLPQLNQCDWIVEAVAENLEIKNTLLARVEPHLAAHAVVTTNTSGLPVSQIAAGLRTHRQRFFGTHFFNPPRYMRLLEVIPTEASDAALVRAFAAFADRMLGKQTVFAKDTPNFIANRVGVAVLFAAASLMMEQGLTIEEVDTLTGRTIGWPRTGTFRLADMVGIDVLAHVAANFPQGVQPGGFSSIPQEMVSRGWLGDKAGQGFYKKIRSADGSEQRFVLDLTTMEYRAVAKASIPALEMAKNAATVEERLRLMMANDPAKDKAARFLWPFLSFVWNFAAERIGEAADDAPSIDEAMRAGFNWELGPFQMWDAVGVRASVTGMKELGLPVSSAAGKMLDAESAPAEVSWYA